jgi:single-strand DNA-binding protein
MLYTHFIGRIGKDAQVINGSKGDFLSMDVAVSDFFKGQETTTWVRVRSNRHVNLQKWLTKGKLLLIEGVLSKPYIWTDKQGAEHVQMSVTADNIHFVSNGKKKDGTATDKAVTPTETTKAGEPKDEDPLGAPTDNGDNAPF